MNCIKYQENNLFYQKKENFDQIMRKIYQESIHKTSKPFHYNHLSNHINLNISTSLLLITYQIKQLQKRIKQKQLLQRLNQKVYFENYYVLVSTNLKNLLLNLQLNSFSTHQRNVFFNWLKSLWVSLTLKNDCSIFSVFDTPVGDTRYLPRRQVVVSV